MMIGYSQQYSAYCRLPNVTLRLHMFCSASSPSKANKELFRGVHGVYEIRAVLIHTGPVVRGVYEAVGIRSLMAGRGGVGSPIEALRWAAITRYQYQHQSPCSSTSPAWPWPPTREYLIPTTTTTCFAALHKLGPSTSKGAPGAQIRAPYCPVGDLRYGAMLGGKTSTCTK
jgi:hypothetical protein